MSNTVKQSIHVEAPNHNLVFDVTVYVPADVCSVEGYIIQWLENLLQPGIYEDVIWDYMDHYMAQKEPPAAKPPMNHDAAMGYAIMAMRSAGLNENQIRDVGLWMAFFFGHNTPEEAASYYKAEASPAMTSGR